MDEIGLVPTVIMAAALLGLYFLPAIFAFRHAHPNARSILALNAFTGWTLFGWAAACIWAMVPPREQ